MFYLILINFLIFSLGQLASISRTGGGFNIYLFDIFIIFTNLIILFYIATKGKFKINFPFVVFTIFLSFSFILTLVQVYFFPFLELVKVLSYLFRFSQYFFFGYFLYCLIINNLLKIEEIIRILILNFYFLLILNILQMTFLYNLTEIAKLGWDPHIGRLTGTFLDPNFMAFYLCLYFIANHFYLKNTYVEYFSIISIFLTQSRNGIITLLLIYLFINIRNLKKLFVLITISITFLLVNPRILDRFLQFSDSNDSSYVRLISWTEAVKILSITDYSGLGFNNYRNNLEFYRVVDTDSLSKNSVASTDSSLLHILVTLGPVGLAMFLVLILSFLISNGFVKINFVIILALLFNSQFINSLFYPQISMLIFVLLFIGLELKKTEKI